MKTFKGVKCVSKWKLPEDTYPGGLDSLRKDYGSPFLLYGPYFCTDNQWNQRSTLRVPMLGCRRQKSQ